MIEPIETPDAVYEDSIVAAERRFYLESVGWRNAVVEERKVLAPVPEFNPNEWFAGLMKLWSPAYDAAPGHTQATTKPTVAAHTSAGIVRKWIQICREYGESKLRAYAYLLSRRGLSRSQVVTEIQNRADVTLDDIRQNKWMDGIKFAEDLLAAGNWREFAWRSVEAEVREFVSDDLLPEIWFLPEYNPTAVIGIPSVVPHPRLVWVKARMVLKEWNSYNNIKEYGGPTYNTVDRFCSGTPSRRDTEVRHQLARAFNCDVSEVPE